MFDTLRDNSRIIVYIVVIAFVVSGGFMGYGAYLNNQGGGGQAPNQGASVIAEVNGIEVSQQEYFSLLQQQAPKSNLSSTQIIPFRYNILNALIERKLVLAKAEEFGIEVEISESEIDENYKNILEQNDKTEQELADILAERGSSLGELKADIKSSLEDSKIITQTINRGIDKIEVSEQEIKKLYEQRYPADNEEITAQKSETKTLNEKSENDLKPKLDDVKEELKKEISNKKRNKSINKWISELKKNAEIIINNPVLSAYHALQNKNYAQAVEKFSVLVEQEETDPIFYSYLAQAYQGQNNNEQAEKVYNTAVENYPENNDLRFNFARYLADQDKDELALAQLDKISAAAGNDYMTHYQLFIMYQQLGAEEKAQSAVEEIQRISQEMQQKKKAPKIKNENNGDISDENEDMEADIEVENSVNTENNN